MVNPVIKNKALVSFHDPDKRIGRYYSPNGVPSDLHIVVACSASRLSGLGKRKFIADRQLWVDFWRSTNYHFTYSEWLLWVFSSYKFLYGI